jgi:hypothetical protein
VREAAAFIANATERTWPASDENARLEWSLYHRDDRW